MAHPFGDGVQQQRPAGDGFSMEDLLEKLPRDVFQADDSLGWVYQFWQADRKDEINKSETKIGADFPNRASRPGGLRRRLTVHRQKCRSDEPQANEPAPDVVFLIHICRPHGVTQLSC